MAIILDGTTGITAPDITSSAGLDAADLTGTLPIDRVADLSITAAKLHTTAVTDKLGYTPAPNTDAQFQGRFYHSGIWTGTCRTGNAGNVSKTFKVCSVQSYYWGGGGVIIEVWRTYYSGFGYGKYRIDGHGATPYGPGYSITALQTNGGLPGVSLSGLITSAEDSTAQYVNVLIGESPYGASIVRVTSANGLVMREPGYTTGSNRVIMYNDYTAN